MRLFPALMISLAAAHLAGARTVLHVAPNGNDGGPGTAEAPLATLEGARERVRAVKANGPVVVRFAPGEYVFAAAVTFAAEDSGSADAPIQYRASATGEVRFLAGVKVGDWGPVSDAVVRGRLSPEARTRVRLADLKAQGITNWGKLSVHGFAKGSPPAEAELFADRRPLKLARWPNEGFLGISNRPDLQTVVLDTDRVSRWVDESDPWVFAYWHHDWAELHEPITGVVPGQRAIKRSDTVKPQYGITPGRARWYAYNLLSELDAPGEYYLDRGTGKLYVWPPEPDMELELSIADGLIRAQDLSHVTFRGFTMEMCRATAVVLRGGTGCAIEGCTIRNTGHRAVVVSGGTGHTVYGCDVYACGEGGVSMAGGDRKALTPAGHTAENNHVHHYSRRCRTYKTGISVRGVGNRIAHNLIHHGPHMALSAGGNDHVVEYNEIHNAVYESGDAGAYYVGRDWTQRGNILRYNYWHQIVGATGHGGMTIYLDDQHCGHTIYGNIFERCSRAVFIGGGDDNTVTSNVFVDCWKAAHVDNRGMGWQKKASDDPNGQLRTRLRAMPYTSDLWAARYPTLPGILQDDPNVPKRNVFRSNVSAGGLWDDIHKGTRHHQTVEKNLVFDDDSDWIQLVKRAGGGILRITFKDPAAVAAIGFEPIPVTRIGLYLDPRRASWPVARRIDRVSLPEPPKPKPVANLPANPTFAVPREPTGITVDGVPEVTEWGPFDSTRDMVLTVDYDGTLRQHPARAKLRHDGTRLYVAVTCPLPGKPKLGTVWGGNEAVELAVRAADGPNADTLILRGYAAGTWETCGDAGAGAPALAALADGVAYAAKVGKAGWTAEWSVPLRSLGVVPGDRIRANITVRRTADGAWLMWRPTRGNSYLVERVGTLELRP